VVFVAEYVEAFVAALAEILQPLTTSLVAVLNLGRKRGGGRGLKAGLFRQPDLAS
jgi:hypothetical protein